MIKDLDSIIPYNPSKHGGEVVGATGTKGYTPRKLDEPALREQIKKYFVDQLIPFVEYGKRIDVDPGNYVARKSVVTYDTYLMDYEVNDPEKFNELNIESDRIREEINNKSYDLRQSENPDERLALDKEIKRLKASYDEIQQRKASYCTPIYSQGGRSSSGGFTDLSGLEDEFLQIMGGSNKPSPQAESRSEKLPFRVRMVKEGGKLPLHASHDFEATPLDAFFRLRKLASEQDEDEPAPPIYIQPDSEEFSSSIAAVVNMAQELYDKMYNWVDTATREYEGLRLNILLSGDLTPEDFRSKHEKISDQLIAGEEQEFKDTSELAEMMRNTDPEFAIMISERKKKTSVSGTN